MFDIKEGVLRCGDDLYFNESNLIRFLNSRKYDYYGQSKQSQSYKCVNKNVLRKRGIDYFMTRYYQKHPEDFLNPHHNLKGIDVSMYSLRPRIYGAVGVFFFLSNKACATLVRHMEKINFNILHYDKFTRTYPYVIEDCGVAFIMYMNDIIYIDNQAFIYKGNEYQLDISEFLKSNTIVMHTNRYK
jgi:hypothetical protein